MDSNRTFLTLIAAMLASLTAASAAPIAPAEREVEELSEDEQMAAGMAELDRSMADFLAMGDQVPGWNETGVDMESLLNGMPGGQAGNYLLGVDEEGNRELSIGANPSVTELVPVEWRLIEELGRPPGDADDVAVQIAPIDARFIMVARASYWRSGRAVCARSDGSIMLYERPDAPSEMNASEARFAIAYLMGRFMHLTTCARYDEVEPGRYSVTAFSEEGRPFTGLNARQQVFEIVPAAAIEDLLQLD